MYRNGIKRLLAVVLSLCGMVCLSWLFLILAIAIKIDSPARCSSNRSGWASAKSTFRF